MKGTVYVMAADGTVLIRNVMRQEVSSVEEFKAWAWNLPQIRESHPPVRLEFGPIGEPWRKL